MRCTSEVWQLAVRDLKSRGGSIDVLVKHYFENNIGPEIGALKLIATAVSKFSQFGGDKSGQFRDLAKMLAKVIDGEAPERRRSVASS